MKNNNHFSINDCQCFAEEIKALNPNTKFDYNWIAKWITEEIHIKVATEYNINKMLKYMRLV